MYEDVVASCETLCNFQLNKKPIKQPEEASQSHDFPNAYRETITMDFFMKQSLSDKKPDVICTAEDKLSKRFVFTYATKC